MIGKIKKFNFKSLLILNTFALIVTSYFFNNFILIGVFILFFFISLLTTKNGLEIIRKLNLLQNIRTEGPSNHFKKSDTPTMGGIFMIVPFLIFLTLITINLGSLKLFLVLITIFGFLFVIFTSSDYWQIYIFVILITGIGIGIDLIIPQIELADILDVNNENRLSQFFTSFFSIIRKAAIGIAAGIALTGYGYLQSINFTIHPNIPNIMIFYFFIPLTIKLFVLILVMRYRSKFNVSIRE